MSQINTNAILDASGGTTTTVNGFTPTVSNMAGRNRIINGAMVFDQRNAGASVTPTTTGFTLDRWQATVSTSSKFSVQQNAGSVTPPVGFKNYLGCTSLSAYSVGSSDYFMMRQAIEGFNTSDFAWGTASASPITISFWVRSSLTGTFGGAIENNASNRSYPFSYTVSAANTWEQKSITIAGDTTGTWATDNSIGLMVAFTLGAGSTYSGTAGSWSSTRYFSATGATSVVGTNGATFYITGVQLEAGSVATPFEHRQYGQELALCQRYYWRVSETSFFPTWGSGMCSATTTARLYVKHPVNMRARPTYSYGGTVYVVAGSSIGIVSAIGGANSTLSSATVDLTTTGLPVGNGAISYPASGLTNFVEAGAEL
jgi:hypothetical protein